MSQESGGLRAAVLGTGVAVALMFSLATGAAAQSSEGDAQAPDPAISPPVTIDAHEGHEAPPQHSGEPTPEPQLSPSEDPVPRPEAEPTSSAAPPQRPDNDSEAGSLPSAESSAEPSAAANAGTDEELPEHAPLAPGDVRLTGEARLVPAEAPGASEQWVLESEDELLPLVGDTDDLTANAETIVTGELRSDGSVKVEQALVAAEPAEEAGPSTPAAPMADLVQGAPSQVRTNRVWVVGVDVPGDALDKASINPTSAAARVAEIDEYFRKSTSGSYRFSYGGFLDWREPSAEIDACSFLDVAGVARWRLDLNSVPSEDLFIAITDEPCGDVAGQAFVGVPGVAVYADPSSGTWGHELGHNIGLGHSAAAVCPAGLVSACSEALTLPSYWEYGGIDIMAASAGEPATAWPRLSPVHRVVLGVPYADTFRVSAPTSNSYRAALSWSWGSGLSRAVHLDHARGDVYLDAQPDGEVFAHSPQEGSDGVVRSVLHAVSTQQRQVPPGVAMAGDLSTRLLLDSVSDGPAQILLSNRAAPKQPRAVQASGGQNIIDLEWTVPSYQGRGELVRDYFIYYRPAGSTGSFTRFLDDISTQRTSTIIGLLGGLGYEVQIVALNKAGKGLPSSLIPADVSGGKPTPLISLSSRDGKLAVVVRPRLSGTQSWRYVLQRKVGTSWQKVISSSTRGKSETGVHAVALGTYRVRVLSGQHGHLAAIGQPYRLALPKPTATLTTVKGKLRAKVSPALPGDKSWKYQLQRRTNGTWTTLLTTTTIGASEYRYHNVVSGTYRVKVLGGQHGHAAAYSPYKVFRR